jgi:hypothetical protein
VKKCIEPMVHVGKSGEKRSSTVSPQNRLAMNQDNPTSSNDVNPYAPPDVVDAMVEPNWSDAEQIRKDHTTHEASIKSVGLLYCLGDSQR